MWQMMARILLYFGHDHVEIFNNFWNDCSKILDGDEIKGIFW